MGWGGSDWNASGASDARTFRVLCIAAIACLYGCVMVLSIRAWQNTVRLMDPQNGVTADQMKAAYGNFLNHFGKLLDEASDDDSDLSLVLSSTSPVSTASSESSGVLAEDRDDASSGASRTAGADAQSKQAAAQTQPKQSERARPSQEASAEAEQKQQEAAEQAAQKQKEAEEAREQAIQKQQAAAQARKAELLAQKETADWFESFVSQYNPDNPGAVVGSLFTSECSADTVKDVYNRMASSLDPGKAHSECRVVKQTDTSLVVLLYGYSADDQSDISGCALAFEKAGDSVLYSANVYAQYACPTCGGSGAITTYTTCPTCGGSGQQYIPNAMYDTVMGWQGIWQACPGCGGTGQIPHYETCSACGGWGIATSSLI